MTGEDPATADSFRHLLGRTFKVTECDADPEFVAKVVQIQKELSPKPNVDLLTSSLPAPPSGRAVQSTDEHVEDQAVEPQNEDPSGDKLEGEVVPQEFLEGEEAPQASAPGRIESDGSCLSSPEKEKEKETARDSDHQSLIRGAGRAVDAKEQVRALGGLNDDCGASLINKPPPSRSEEEESSDDELGSDVNRGYSSQETLAENDNTMQMEVGEQDLPYQDESDRLHSYDLMNVIQSVSDRIDLFEYSQAEWKGTTYFAECMRLGYSKIVAETGCAAMRKIRGDNYCGLRATCFQVLSQNLNVLRSWGNNLDDISNIPQILVQNYQCTWLKRWSFAGRLEVTQKKAFSTMKQCLVALCDQLKIANSLESYQERTEYFLDYFNSGKPDEVLLFEAFKLLMLHSAVVLHKDIADGKENVPLFATLLFVRDTCESPEQLMTKHLNTVGDTGGLEQVEMFLLGYALNLTIRVARPSKVEDDFISFYPDDHKDDWDMCNLIAEDDRHYNILVH